MGKLFIIEQHEEANTDAIAKGLEVAELLGKQPQVFAYCYEYFSGDDYYSPRLAGAAQQRLMKEKQAEVSAHLKELDAEDVPLHIIWSKYLYEHVSNHAGRYGFDMVVKTVHQSEHFLPTDWHLIRSTKVPLMLLSDNPIKKASSILMAVDLDARSQQKQRLNQLVLQHGRQLAEASGAKLHLAHVIRVPKVIRDLEVLNLHEMVKSAWRKHQPCWTRPGSPKSRSISLPAIRIFVCISCPAAQERLSGDRCSSAPGLDGAGDRQYRRADLAARAQQCAGDPNR